MTLSKIEQGDPTVAMERLFKAPSFERLFAAAQTDMENLLKKAVRSCP
jgi:hypothetical protein